MQVLIQENRNTLKVIQNRQDLVEKIQNFTLFLLQNKTYKIKKVKGYRYLSQNIYEYKLCLEEIPTYRVAYVFQQKNVLIFFFSKVLIKAEFLKVLSKESGVQKV